MGGNTVVRVGVVVLFFGIAFALKYAYEHTHIPIEARLTAVCIAAESRTAHDRLAPATLQRPGYALALQGGGVGVLLSHRVRRVPSSITCCRPRLR